MKKIEDLYGLLGTDNVEQAIKNLEDERQGMRELHDENNALRIYNRRLRLVVNYALQVFDLCERDLALFVTAKMRDMMRKSREQIKAADKAISESAGLCEVERNSSSLPEREPRT